MEFKKVHLLFEQSGHFKDEFIKLGFSAFDYDILNDFGKTDRKIDLFLEIEKADRSESSIFDEFSSDDLIIAFFPCIRFERYSQLVSRCEQSQTINLSLNEKLVRSENFMFEVSYYYSKLCELVRIALNNNLKLIIENPYQSDTLLPKYFPLKPALIDYDRTQRGDFFIKPTMFYFINCSPSNNLIIEDLQVFKPNRKSLAFDCNPVERSMISLVYVNRFIREFIL